MVDMLRGEPTSSGKFISPLAHFVPFGGWRRWAGQSLMDSYREINSSIWNDRSILDSGPMQVIRKDNLLSELLTNQPLALKYNMLNGEKYKDTNMLGRLWRATSMVAIEPGASPGQKLLWRSNYDLRASTWYSPDGLSLKDSANVRSEFSRQMGLVKINGMNLEQWLNKIAKSPRVIASVNEMINDRRNGEYDVNPLKAYYHNRLIRERFDRVRKEAWDKLRNLPEVAALRRQKEEINLKTQQKLRKTTTQELPLHPGR